MFQNTKSFSGEEIYKMSNSDLWRGCLKDSQGSFFRNNDIINNDIINNDQKYKLYATGECTIPHGRIYIFLPDNLIITSNIISKYNLI